MSFHYKQPKLENERVALVPFDPSIHSAKVVKEAELHPELLNYILFPASKSLEEFLAFYAKNIEEAPANCLYSIIDKSNTGPKDLNTTFAGTIALTSTSPENACTELGIMIFSAFQRTHVTSNAIGLVLQYTLDPPSAGGLGLRRVEWRCHAENQASRKTALRMGFEFEGILRWDKIFPGGAIGLSVDALEKRNGSSGEVIGRHTAVFSIVWDEWEEKRPKVVKQMERGQ
ncbi:acyl-CoA N-acyltransferase [Penicillium sp. IBT 18751x]|nr:acyl-CoA N-acyltransferase [Penicillium sp. IBT 18751x]